MDFSFFKKDKQQICEITETEVETMKEFLSSSIRSIETEKSKEMERLNMQYKIAAKKIFEEFAQKEEKYRKILEKIKQAEAEKNEIQNSTRQEFPLSSGTTDVTKELFQ